MKIIFTEKDKLKELGDEELIAENVNDDYVHEIVNSLNEQISHWSGFEYVAKENDYVLLKRFEEEEAK